MSEQYRAFPEYVYKFVSLFFKELHDPSHVIHIYHIPKGIQRVLCTMPVPCALNKVLSTIINLI